MAYSLIRFPFFLMTILFLAFGCGWGTETGNPETANPGVGNPAPTTTSYANDDYGVALEYESGWSFDEVEASSAASAPASEDAAPESQISGIDTSDAASTQFTDGITTVTFYYVTFNQETSLIAYLNSLFSTRSFEIVSNDYISGYLYDNPEVGETGGDLREYYFLDGTTLVYIVTDLFNADNGFIKFETIIDSLRFE